jgi:PPOX class probable F420-dependent enzyme
VGAFLYTTFHYLAKNNFRYTLPQLVAVIIFDMSNAIDEARYILFGTRKRDGSMVDTPVWFAGTQGNYYVFSADSAGKVKRLKNFSEVQIAPCNVTGKPLGITLTAKAEFVSAQSEINTAHQALIKKYGWQMRGLDFLSKLSGKFYQRRFIKIST